MDSAGNKHMFRYNFYDSRLNSFKVIVIIPFITPIYPLITPISGTNTRGILDFWYVFSCCLNNICWNFQLVTNFFQVSMSFRLIPLDYIPVSLEVDTCHLSLLVQSCYGHFSDNLKIIATEGFKLQNVSLVSLEWDIKTLLRLLNWKYIFWGTKKGVVSRIFWCVKGGGPRVVVNTAAFHARVRGSVPGLGGLKETKIVSSPSTCES